MRSTTTTSGRNDDAFFSPASIVTAVWTVVALPREVRLLAREQVGVVVDDEHPRHRGRLLGFRDGLYRESVAV